MRLGAMLTDILKSTFKKPATERYPFVKKAAPRNLRGKIVWDREACTACGLCAKDCPSNAIKIIAYNKKEKDIVFEYQLDTCLYCSQCVHTCNRGALRMSNDDWEIAALSREYYTLVWGEDDSVDKYLAGELPEEPAKKNLPAEPKPGAGPKPAAAPAE